MDKDQLKQFLEGMDLEAEFKTLLFGLIDQAPQIDDKFLNSIADLLDLQADYYEKSADLLEEEADVYEELALELNTIGEEASAARMEALLENQKNLLDSLNQKMQESTKQQETNRIGEVQQQLQQMSQAVGPSAVPSAENPQAVHRDTIKP